MSINTWEKEFLPEDILCGADDVLNVKQCPNSISLYKTCNRFNSTGFFPVIDSVLDLYMLLSARLYWSGYLPENLKKHKVHWDQEWSLLCDERKNECYIPDTFGHMFLCEGNKPSYSCCTSCPIYRTLGKKCYVGKDNLISEFINTGNPFKILSVIGDAITSCSDILHKNSVKVRHCSS